MHPVVSFCRSLHHQLQKTWGLERVMAMGCPKPHLMAPPGGAHGGNSKAMGWWSPPGDGWGLYHGRAGASMGQQRPTWTIQATSVTPNPHHGPLKHHHGLPKPLKDHPSLIMDHLKPILDHPNPTTDHPSPQGPPKLHYGPPKPHHEPSKPLKDPSLNMDHSIPIMGHQPKPSRTTQNP